MNKIGWLLLLLPFFGFSQKQFEVFFDFNAAYPNAVSLQKLKEWKQGNKTVEVTKFLGYCDSVDDSKYNKDLAMRRISSVLELLKKDSISISNTVELKPFGKDFELSKNQEENRKVVFFYIEKETKPVAVPKDVDETFVLAKDVEELVEQESSELAAKFDKAQKGDLIRINNINFHFNSEKMISASLPLLDELLQIMHDNLKLRIAIHGHICCNPNGMDTKLSYRRALVIFKYLNKGGIQVNRLSYKGFGSNDPIYKVPERNEAERKANRRVEILIVEK